MIKVTALNRFYGDFQAVKNVSFEIPKGEIVGLLGHNGAGKTTIMKMLTGFLEPSSGAIEIDGLNIENDRLGVQRKIGYLPENDPLYGELTVLDYLEFAAELREINPDKRPELIRSAIKKTALTEKARERIDTLSKGYKQRVGVAQAILNNPPILILDEPTNGLDPRQIHEMRKLIRDLAAQATVILSTHIMQEVEAVCDRVLIVRQGELVVDSRLADLKQSVGIILSVDKSLKDLKAIFSPLSEITAIEELGSTAGITDFRIKVSADPANVLPLLAEKAVSGGARLYRLSREEISLETVFRKVS